MVAREPGKYSEAAASVHRARATAVTASGPGRVDNGHGPGDQHSNLWSKNNVSRSCNRNSGFFYVLIFIEVLELDLLFGSLLDRFVSGFVRVNVLSTFESDAV